MQGRPLSQGVWKSGKYFLKQVKLFPFLRFRGESSWKQMFYVLIFSLSELTNVLCFNFSFLESGLILKKKNTFHYHQTEIYLWNEPEWENKGWQEWEQFPWTYCGGAWSAVNLNFFGLWNTFVKKKKQYIINIWQV